jgi:hypothetical protein
VGYGPTTWRRESTEGPGGHVEQVKVAVASPSPYQGIVYKQRLVGVAEGQVIDGETTEGGGGMAKSIGKASVAAAVVVVGGVERESGTVPGVQGAG